MSLSSYIIIVLFYFIFLTFTNPINIKISTITLMFKGSKFKSQICNLYNIKKYDKIDFKHHGTNQNPVGHIKLHVFY